MSDQFFIKVPARVFTFAFILLQLQAARCYAFDSYCGMYCVFAVLKSHDVSVEFEGLLKPEFIQGFEGSTSEGIRAAFVANGLSACTYRGLGIADLRLANEPLVLHVRSSRATREYDHWVVYFGEVNGHAKILDPTVGMQSLTYPELLSLWDGIAVQTRSSFYSKYVWSGLGLVVRFGVFLLLMVVAYVVGKILYTRTSIRLGSSIWWNCSLRFFAVTVMLIVVGVCFDALASKLLWNPTAVASIASAHQLVRFEEISENEAREALNRVGGDTVFIDCRFARDYAAGTIPGALSIAIDESVNSEQSKVTNLSKNARLIIFCQSKGCGFSDAVAQRLRAYGFSNVRILRNGFRDWQQAGFPVSNG